MMNTNGPLLKILFIGDVVGKGGRSAVKKLVSVLKDRYHASFVIVNAENSANGAGISKTCIDDMNTAPIDVYTAGDHIWDQKSFEHEILEYKSECAAPCQYEYIAAGERLWGIPESGRRGSGSHQSFRQSFYAGKCLLPL